MAIDKIDFAHQVQQNQAGLPPGFFPIILNPSTGGPGGGAMALGQEYEVAINPCDHIWLPTFYDPSIGLNPAQNFNPVAGLYTLAPFQGPEAFTGAPQTIPVAGMNIFDVNDCSSQSTGGGNPTSPNVQQAAIFSLRFNSPNAPWLLWSLSNMLNTDGSAVLFSLLGSTPTGALVGQGDAMRSITGPVSRLWVKYLRWAIISVYDGNAQGWDFPVSSIPASQIVLMSSLGFSQQTVGAQQTAFSFAEIVSGSDGANTVKSYPQANAGAGAFAVAGGGYTQTKVSTLDRLELEKRGLGSTRPPDGRR